MPLAMPLVSCAVSGAIQALEVAICAVLARIIHEGLSEAEFRVKIVCDLVVGVDWRTGSWGVDR